MRTEYLLDTHILIWLITENDKLNEHIRNRIEYFEAVYHVSPMSLLEIVELDQLNKLGKHVSVEDVMHVLHTFNIQLDQTTDKEFKTLEKIPFLSFGGNQHTDMVDRYLIAHAISHKYTMISSDRKFPEYRKYGLTLLEN